MYSERWALDHVRSLFEDDFNNLDRNTSQVREVQVEPAATALLPHHEIHGLDLSVSRCSACGLIPGIGVTSPLSIVHVGVSRSTVKSGAHHFHVEMVGLPGVLHVELTEVDLHRTYDHHPAATVLPLRELEQDRVRNLPTGTVDRTVHDRLGLRTVGWNVQGWRPGIELRSTGRCPSVTQCYLLAHGGRPSATSGHLGEVMQRPHTVTAQCRITGLAQEHHIGWTT